MSTPYPAQYPTQTPTCFRHPDRPTYVSCARCQRYICPECMVAASVGHQCPECVGAGAASIREPRTPFGGRLGSGKPVVTYVLIAINVAMFILQSSSATLESQLTLWSPAVANGELYRLLTSAFLHYGLMHILFNMYALFIVGPPLERWLGRSRFISLYLLSALGGAVLVYLLSPLNSATAGASGAIFGLFGATFIVGKRLNLDVRWIIGLVVINLAITFVLPAISSQQISWQGHVGGLVTGTAVAWAYAYSPKARQTAVHIGVIGGLLALFVVLVWWRTHELLSLYG